MFSVKLTSALVVAGVCLFVFFSAWTMGLAGLIFPPAILIMLVLVGRPPAGLLFFWVVTMFTPSMELFLPNVMVKVMEQSLGLCLLAVVLGRYCITKQPPKGTKVINNVMILLLLWVGIATIVNKVPAKSLVFYVLTYLKPFWVFYFALTFLDQRHARPFLVVFVLSAAIQIVFNVFYYMGLNPLPMLAYRSFVDASIGTLGTCTHVSYLLIGLLCVLSAVLKRARTTSVLLLTYVAIAISGIQFYLTYSLHAYPLLFGPVAMQSILFRKRAFGSVRRIIIPMVAVAVVALAFMAAGPRADRIGRAFSAPRLRYLWDRTVYGIKGNSYRQVFFSASSYLPYPWIGGGPGNYTSNIARLTRRPLASLQHLTYREYAFNRRQISLGGSIMTIPMTGFITIWGELGVFGFLMFWGLHVYAIQRVWRRLRTGQYIHRMQQILAEAFVPTMTMFIVLNILVEAIAIMHIFIPLWIWAAIVWNPYLEEESVEPPAET